MIGTSDQFKNKRVKRMAALALGVSVSTAWGSVLAQEGELFSLPMQPGVQDDGNNEVITGRINGVPFQVVQGYAIAQGDMVLGRFFADSGLEIPVQTRGLGLNGALERWPDGIVPYQFSDDITQIQRDRAQIAIAHWNARTSIKLVARDAANEADYSDFISFEPSNGCASWVGRIGGEQSVWLADSCTAGSMIHEIGHAIGLFHEHTRPDRDSYVTVNWDNVSSGKELNFETIEVGADSYSDYDYGSIMHYGEYFFSNNGERSIEAPDGIVVGQREALSDDDINSVDLMYATDLKLDVSTAAADSNTQIDVLVSNIGSLGANTLKITANLEGADWLSISADADWACEQFDTELRCTLATLAELKDTSFSILVNQNSTSIEELQVRVESKTLDTELNNNVFNDTIPVETVAVTTVVEPQEQDSPSESQDADTATATATEPAAAESVTEVAELAAPATTSTTTTTTTTTTATAIPTSSVSTTSEAVPTIGAANSASSDDSGGGAALHLLLLILIGRFSRLMVRKHT